MLHTLQAPVPPRSTPAAPATLAVVYAGGGHDGETADLRLGTETVDLGRHDGEHEAVYDRYTRSTQVDPLTLRVIFFFQRRYTIETYVPFLRKVLQGGLP